MNLYTLKKKTPTFSSAVKSSPIGAKSADTGAASRQTSGSGAQTTATKEQLTNADGFTPNGKNVTANVGGRSVELSGYGTYMGIPKVSKNKFKNGQGYSPNGGDTAANVNGRNVTLSGYGTYLANPYEAAAKKLTSAQSSDLRGTRAGVPYDANSNGYGIRAELVNAGLSDADIGWDGQWVTYKGQKLLIPTANINGTTYADRSAIQQAIKQAYAADGINLVQVNQYADRYGQTGLLNYNPSLKDVTIDGQSLPYAFIDDSGNAWAAEDAVSKAFDNAAGRQGIKDPQVFLDAYDKAISKAEASADAAASRMKNWKMSAEDMEKDAAYQAYKQMYLREAARAYADGLGQAAARNGGNLSAAALAAAGQGQQYYLSQLNDRVPELYQMAYERYLNGEQANINNQRQIMQNAQDRYQKQYDANRGRISDANTAREAAYQRLLNDWELKERKQTYDQTEFENVIKRGQARGSFTPEECAYLGIPEGTPPYLAEALYNTYLWDNGGKRIEEEQTRIATDAEKEIQQQSHENNMEAAGMEQQYKRDNMGLDFEYQAALDAAKNRYAQAQTAQDYALRSKLSAEQDARDLAANMILQDPISYAGLSDDDLESLADSLAENGAISEESKTAFISAMRARIGASGY